jgi:1-acyl-sn-glycerol-3-phosphate acyltransferase
MTTHHDEVGPALGSNPLALAPHPDDAPIGVDDPFLTALAAIEARRRWAIDGAAAIEPGPPLPEAAEAGHATNRAPRERDGRTRAERAWHAQGDAGHEPSPTHRARVRPISPLHEIEVPEPRDIFDRFTSDEVRRRIAALGPLVDASVGYDRHGLSLDALRRAAPVFELLYRHYFRVESLGHEHVPAEGPVVLVSNHAGLLPFDGAMIVTDLLLRPDPPRLARSVVDRFVGALPWVNVFMARMGQVIGRRTTVRDLLADEQPVLVFPEGTRGVLKPITERHRLQPFHPGFVREALRAGAPVIPIAVVGSDDQSPILADLKPLARLLGLPGFPITPTFPLLGPLGLLPYPVRYRIVYGEPIDLGDAHRGGGAEDPQRLARLANRVQRRIQHLVNQHEGDGRAPR